MYHCRQKLNMGAASAVILPELETNELGRSCYKMVDQSKMVLPDVETTDLRAMLDAGVQIKRTDTKLFGAGSVVTDMTPEPQEQTDNGEEK